MLQDGLSIAEDRTVAGATEENAHIDEYVAHREPGDKLDKRDHQTRPVVTRVRVITLGHGGGVIYNTADERI